MRNLKKLVALIVTIAMIATFAIPAFAAAPADVVGTDYEGAVTRLVALGVITGRPDGSFGPEDTITRAEFAAVIIRALGHEDVADTAKGVTKFSDVAATHWAAGYINLAVSLDIINGYGDGKFGPNDKVTFDQAIAMIIRALGAGEKAEAEGGFPLGYMLLAKKLKITTDVAGSAGTEAPRGIVALLVNNSLKVTHFEKVGDNTWAQPTSNQTNFLDGLGMDDLATGVIVTETPASAGLDANKFIAGGVTYTAVAGTVDVEALLGKKVDLWGSAVSKVVLAEVVAGTAVAVKTVNSVTDGVYNVTLADGTKKDYTVATGAGALENLEIVTAVAAIGNLVGVNADKVQVTLTVDGDGKIQFVNSVIFNEDAVAAVAVVNTVAKSIKLGNYFIKQNDKAIKKLVIVKDGETVDYTAIAKGDILFVAENMGTDTDDCDDDRLYIKATNKTVAGTLEAAKPSLANATSIKVEGTWYGKSEFLTDISAAANIGKEITLTLDPAGKAYSIAGPTVATSDSYVVILDNALVPATFTTAAVYKVKVLTAAGDTVYYDVVNSTANTDTDAITVDAGNSDPDLKGIIAKLTLNADGAVTKAVLASGTTATSTLDTSKMRFNLLDVNASAVLFYEKADGSFGKLAFADIKDDQSATAATFVDGDIKAMLFDYDEVLEELGYASAVTAGNYAYVTDYTALASSYLIDVITKDGAKTLETTTAVYEAKGTLMSYDVNASGKISGLTAEANDANDLTVTVVDATKIKVTDGTNTYTYWFDTNSFVVYDVDARDGGSAQLLTKADIYVDMIVDVVADGDGDIIAVIISKM